MLAPTTETGVSIERQQEILDGIRANPLGSYVFSGPPGVGKSTLLNEVVRLACIARPVNFPVYYESMYTFQADTTARARGLSLRGGRGLVSPAELMHATRGRTPMLWGVFLDDFDKVTGSEFIRLEIFALVDSIVKTGSQLVLTTNQNKQEFAAFFGDHIAWRIAKHCKWCSVERAS